MFKVPGTVRFSASLVTEPVTALAKDTTTGGAVPAVAPTVAVPELTLFLV